MATNDIYLVKVYSTILDQLCYNMFWYRQSSGAAGSDNAAHLSAEFYSTVLESLVNMFPVQVLFKRIDCINYGDYLNDSDIDDFVNPLSGAITNTLPMPSAVCATVYNPPPALGYRYSYKRFSGLPYVGVSGNSLIPDYQTTIVSACQPFSSVLETEDGAFVPVQVGGQRVYGVNPSVNRELTTSWLVRTYTSTQASRRVNKAP